MLLVGDDPLALSNAVRHEMATIIPDQAAFSFATMDQLLSDSLGARRFPMVLLGAFAVTALVLATMGVFGVMSHMVSQRTHEIGIRKALGAPRRNVLNLVLRQGMTLTLIGLVIGLGLAFALSRVLSTLLYEISPADPATFAATGILLTAVAFLACYVPARKATRIDPMVALRYE
jgi:putative ABC transport system permease protein